MVQSHEPGRSSSDASASTSASLSTHPTEDSTSTQSSRMPSWPGKMRRQSRASTTPASSQHLSPPSGGFLRSRSRSRSRSKSPAPINTAITSATLPHPHTHAGQHTLSPTAMSPTSPLSSSLPASGGKRNSMPPPQRKSSSHHKRLSATVNYYGRHGNDWLFNGFSVRESMGKLWRDRDGDGDGE
ncbi:hypothetical protein AJ80_09009 [Polytolypa hystricis UAMH7299]|uniref:Uncharacterized protein n=1 Tax=Polytolypa hystricis (strain UAMH7299) TaxID=1447883 RepID=A0A2B7WXT6_POLH7|nr:hypothetical protein AJ80_09009 [Polytolypa hystricis UAMH7299]